MKRRSTLKLLASTFVGASALGHWAIGEKALAAVINNSDFSVDEQDLITAIADTILPAPLTEPNMGAIALGVPIYLIASLQRCETAAVRINTKVQLAQLESNSNKTYSQSFLDCEQTQRERLLLTMAHSELKSEKEFFELIKKRCLTGYRTSKDVLTQYYDYQIIPAHYDGCVDLKSKTAV